MRVTDRMMFETSAAHATSARERVERALDEVSSGRKLLNPADDPAGSALATLAARNRDRADAIRKTAERASDELVSADSALDALGNVVERAKELAVQLSNDSYSANDRAGGALEVANLFEHAVAVLNTDVGGRYLFGGTADRAPPFQADGTYVGDAGVREIEVAPGVVQSASVRADVAVKGAGGGVDVLASLASLRDALAANDETGIRSAITDLDQGIAQVSMARSDVGASMRVFDLAAQSSASARDAAETARAGVADSDVVESMSKLALAQRALDAALTATAKSFDLTLLDKMR